MTDPAGTADPGAIVPDAPRPPLTTAEPGPAVGPEPGPAVGAESPLPVAPAPRRRAGRWATILALVLVAITAGSCLFLAGFVLGAQTATQPGTPADAAAEFQPFWDTWAAIQKSYAGDPVTHQQLIQGAIKGMLEALGDPFSFYMSPDDFKNSLQGLSGQFEGIGATTTTRAKDGSQGCQPIAPDCALIVVGTIADSPAEKSDLEAADRITAIDGVSVDGLTPDAALKKIRGPKGTVVTLTIVRGSAAPRDIAITRDVIVQPEVAAKDLAGGKVGYISVSGFSDNASKQFVVDLTADIASGKRAIILDLRGNLGGYVTAAQVIASQFIGSGPIYWERGATGETVPSPTLPGGVATDPGIKVAVLIDKNSASASEIVAGALQDTKRATLVGQQSYGKGTVQDFLPLDGDNGGFRLTIARWLTPNQRWINKTGLTPDVVVPLPADGAPTPAPGTDPVLDRALEVLGYGTSAATMLRAA